MLAGLWLLLYGFSLCWALVWGALQWSNFGQPRFFSSRNSMFSWYLLKVIQYNLWGLFLLNTAVGYGFSCSIVHCTQSTANFWLFSDCQLPPMLKYLCQLSPKSMSLTVFMGFFNLTRLVVILYMAKVPIYV